jgi:hypothetical protein
MRDYFDALIRPTPPEEEGRLDRRRVFMRDSVFKNKPEERTRIGERVGTGNKELLFIDVNISRVNVSFTQAVQSTVPTTSSAGDLSVNSSPLLKRNDSSIGVSRSDSMYFDEETASHTTASSVEGRRSISILLLRLRGVSASAQHSALNSSVKLVMRDLEIEDSLATRIAISSGPVGNLGQG